MLFTMYNSYHLGEMLFYLLIFVEQFIQQKRISILVGKKNYRYYHKSKIVFYLLGICHFVICHEFVICNFFFFFFILKRRE